MKMSPAFAVWSLYEDNDNVMSGHPSSLNKNNATSINNNYLMHHIVAS